MDRKYRQLTAAALCCLMLALPLAGCSSRGQEEPGSGPDEQDSSWEAPSVSSRPESAYRPKRPQVDDRLQEAAGQNADTVGWLTVPGTEIDEAVVQTTDNTHYYRRDALGNESFAGCFWMDYECELGDKDAENFSRNTIIYGHNLGTPQGVKDDPDGVKFAQLLKFDDLDFAKAHPYFYFTTEEGSFIYEIFAVFYSEDVLKPVPYHYASYSGKDFDALISDVRARSQFDYNVEVGRSDKIMTLSTCSYKYGTYSQNPHQRFVVMGRLAEANENYYEEADLQINPDPKAPSFQ